MTFQADERVIETSITTGTGTYVLDGAMAGGQSFAGMGNGNDCPYFATDYPAAINWEVGIGGILTGPNRLTRTVKRSSNADAPINWGGGTLIIRCGWPAWLLLPRVVSKSVAGSADVALTQDEQRCDILILTGVLTGNINVKTDATPWSWTVHNNTTGAFSATLKTVAGTGIPIPQGSTKPLHCDGTNVVETITGLPSQASAAGIGNGADATDDVLFTDNLPVNFLSAYGKTIRVSAHGHFAANANNGKDKKLWFGGTVVTALNPANQNNIDWRLEAEITRIDSTHVSVSSLVFEGNSFLLTKSIPNLAVADLTANATIIKVTGCSTATSTANDVLGYGMTITPLN